MRGPLENCRKQDKSVLNVASKAVNPAKPCLAAKPYETDFYHNSIRFSHIGKTAKIGFARFHGFAPEKFVSQGFAPAERAV
jgi:hypothetical protein